MWRRLSYFPRALKVRWTFAQRGPKWNGADQGYDRYPPLRKVGHAGADKTGAYRVRCQSDAVYFH